MREGDCQTACRFSHWGPFGRQGRWGPFGRQRRAWPHGVDPPHFHMHTEKIGPFFRSLGFPWNMNCIRCQSSPQPRWAPPEHPQDTASTPPASCRRLRLRPVCQTATDGSSFHERSQDEKCLFLDPLFLPAGDVGVFGPAVPGEAEADSEAGLLEDAGDVTAGDERRCCSRLCFCSSRILCTSVLIRVTLDSRR